MKNRFTILGCGSSLGVPWINGNYGKCNPKNNKNIRSRCCAHIQFNDLSILIDTSPDLRLQIIKNNIKNLLMVVNKNKSYDERFKGDFELKKNKLSKEIECDYIYTGCQIINKKIFHDVGDKVFSISKIWDHLLNKKELYGFESNEKFVHLTDLEILNRLTKNR